MPDEPVYQVEIPNMKYVEYSADEMVEFEFPTGEKRSIHRNLAAQFHRLHAAAPAMLELLERLQWSAFGDNDCCPICFRIVCNGHAHDCELAAVLQAAR